ncbi:MAG: transglycosylase SLT domain-containing protein [Acidobacteria bacterium]|nr:transglycosylase SLT domain-containing protein [Acidobacteriota bacterium]
MKVRLEARPGPALLALVLFGSLLGPVACTSTTTTTASDDLAPAPHPVTTVSRETPHPPRSAQDVATDHFQRGKALALSGEAACAETEFGAALDAFHKGARASEPGDRDFGVQLWESIEAYRKANEPSVLEDRLAASDGTPDSLIADPPAPRPEEVAVAKSEVETLLGESTFDIPMVVNEQVLRAVAFYQFRSPQAFAAALQRSGRYMPLMRKILAEKGLPQDLVYVALIESAFKPAAHSRAAAHGFWQFIDATATRYGLGRNAFVEERRDPVKSTLAAAAYYRDLYEMLGDWHLAMAAYDAGEGRIIRGLQRTGARDFWELSASSVLPRETRDYVPFVLGAALIAKNPARFGFDVVPDPPLSFDVVSVRRPVDLLRVAETLEIPVEELRILNTELKTRSTPHGVSEYPLRVPAGLGMALVARIESLPTAPVVAERKIVVRKGETLARVAARAKVSVQSLREWNELGPKARPKAGTALVVRSVVAPASTPRERESGRPAAEVLASASGPSLGTTSPLTTGSVRALPTPSAAVTVSSPPPSPPSPPSPAPGSTSVVEIPEAGFEPPANAARVPGAAPRPATQNPTPARTRQSRQHGSNGKIVYTVRPGDTLFRIASVHGTTVEKIKKTNRLGKASVLRAGQQLVLVASLR